MGCKTKVEKGVHFYSVLILCDGRDHRYVDMIIDIARIVMMTQAYKLRLQKNKRFLSQWMNLPKYLVYTHPKLQLLNPINICCFTHGQLMEVAHGGTQADEGSTKLNM